jgi:hypothetical protein
MIFITLLSASNPKPYATLGDVIYNDLSSIEALKSIISDHYEHEIEKYVKNVEETKKIGFSLEKGDSEIDKKKYLEQLRKLLKSHNSFVRIAYGSYNESMKKKNYIIFSKLINNPLIKAKKEEEEIMDFYYKHSTFIDASSGFIHKVLEEKEQKQAQRKYKTKKILAEEKIKRVRKNDKLDEAQREAELQAEVLKKNLEIRENQKRELAR